MTGASDYGRAAHMQRELERLLQGSGAEQDLFGLVVAAGGGLSALDLAPAFRRCGPGLVCGSVV